MNTFLSVTSIILWVAVGCCVIDAVLLITLVYGVERPPDEDPESVRHVLAGFLMYLACLALIFGGLASLLSVVANN